MSEQRERIKVLTAGIFSLMLAMGIARFAYTPLLPLMQKQAHLGIADAGWLAAINYGGYLTGALIASLISDLVLKDRLYRIGLVLAIITTAQMGLTNDLTVWAISRFLAGLSSAAAMLMGTGLILNWLIRHNHRSELGIHFAGIGLGIASCAFAVEIMSHWLDWRSQWYVLTFLGCIVLVPALAWLPAPDTSSTTKTGQKLVDNPPSPLFLRLFMAAYFCAGVGYVISATFIVAIVDRLPGLAGKGTLTFLALGLAAAPACIVWDFIARRTGDLNALILAAMLQIIGILLPLSGGVVAAFAGAMLFGGFMAHQFFIAAPQFVELRREELQQLPFLGEVDVGQLVLKLRFDMFCNACNATADLDDRNFGFAREFAHFIRNHRKSAPGLASTRSFDSCIERQQIRLPRHMFDQLNQ